jgi:hypothetical protein
VFEPERLVGRSDFPEAPVLSQMIPALSGTCAEQDVAFGVRRSGHSLRFNKKQSNRLGWAELVNWYADCALCIYPRYSKMSWERHVLASKRYLELGMFGDAVQALEEISAKDQRQKEVLYARVLVSLATRNWDMAVPLAVDLVKAEPKNPIPWLLLAYAVRYVEMLSKWR